jgi:Asp-tRNA(Asn)/Glu-tRNA(Gln) amidotransferase C subunit
MVWQKTTEVWLEKIKGNPEKTKVSLEELEAAVHVFEEKLNKMDTTDLEANWEKLEAIAVHREDPYKETKAKTVRTQEGRHEDWHVAVGCRQKPKKRTQGDGASWKECYWALF